jgi:hypothetical protein
LSFELDRVAGMEEEELGWEEASAAAALEAADAERRVEG